MLSRDFVLLDLIVSWMGDLKDQKVVRPARWPDVPDGLTRRWHHMLVVNKCAGVMNGWC